MKIKLAVNQKNTSRVLDALLEASKFRMTEEWKRKEKNSKWQSRHIYINGYLFHNTKDTCEHIMSSINNILIPNGLIDLDIFRYATNSAGLNMFDITE